MSHAIFIGIAKHIDAFRDTLDSKTHLLENAGIKIRIQEQASGRFVIFSCSGGDTGLDPLCLSLLAAAVADLIISRWEKVMLFNITKTGYPFLKEDERRCVYELALARMEHPDGEHGQLTMARRKRLVQTRLEEFLLSSSHLNVDGFVVFRLKDYLADLRWVVGRAVEDFLLEREYREFISLLRFFLENQRPRAVTVHVVVRPPGRFQLYDHDFRPVSYQYMDGLIVDVNHSEIDYEDILISALITIAPVKVVLHAPGPVCLTPHTLTTLQAVFQDKVAQCPGCRFCMGTDKAGR